MIRLESNEQKMSNLSLIEYDLSLYAASDRTPFFLHMMLLSICSEHGVVAYRFDLLRFSCDGSKWIGE